MTKLTTGQAAQRLQYHRRTVLRLLQDGAIRGERLTKTGQYRILEADLLAYAAAHNLTLFPAPQPQGEPATQPE